MAYTDILYEKKNGVAWITINRPEVRNAFRTITVAELTDAFLDARWDPAVGVAVLTGAGDKAFCSGGDQKARGEKKAREIWYLCRQYSAADALAMGLVNKVVPLKDLRAEVEKWCAELLDKSPTALALAKQSFNIDSEPRAGVAQFAHTALGLYYQTAEAMEGRNAFVEKRPVDFKRFRK